jgi:dolichol-phosphate mannosyltransferase
LTEREAQTRCQCGEGNTTEVTYTRQPRHAGTTKFTLGKMVHFALDAITSFAYVPLQLASYLGFVMALISATAIIAVVAFRLLGSDRGSDAG